VTLGDVKIYREWLIEERDQQHKAQAFSELTRLWSARLRGQRDEAAELRACLDDCEQRATDLEAEKTMLQKKMEELQQQVDRDDRGRREKTLRIALTDLGQPMMPRPLRRVSSLHLY